MPREADVIVDALFGTGFQGEPREAARQVEEMNASGAHVVSVDVPSGVDASTGEVAGACVQATDRDVPRAQGRPRGRAGALPRG